MKEQFNRKIFFDGLKIFISYLKPYKVFIFGLVVLSLFSAAFSAMVPLLGGKIFDAIIAIEQNPNTALGTVFGVILIWLILRLLGDVFDWRIAVGNNTLGAKVEGEYIAYGFGRLLQMPMALHKTKKHGDLGERINQAANWMDGMTRSVLIDLMPRFLGVVLAIVFTLTINVRLALVLILAILIYGVLLWRSVPHLAGIQKKMFDAYSRAYGDAWDALSNVRAIKQATAEHYEEKRIYRRFVSQAVKYWLALNSIWERLDFSQRLIITLTQFAIFAISVFFVRDRIITPGELAAFNAYAAMLFGPFVVLGRNWQTIQNGLLAIVNAEKLLRLPTEIYVPKKAIQLTELKGEIRFEDVVFEYGGGEKILDGVSFHVLSGENVALIGKSGVGKTTVLDLILAFHFPTSGRILIDGMDIKKLDLRTYRSQIGIVPQDPTLFNDTVEMNIKYGNFGKSKEAIKKAAEKAHAAEFIEKFPKKYNQRVGWLGVKLSAGQKQRIAIARVILRNPKILILDEPTSALDAESERYIKESLKELMKNRTTLIVAHRLSTVRAADKILVLDRKKIAEIGSHDELIKKPKGIYRRFYELQTGFYE